MGGCLGFYVLGIDFEKRGFNIIDPPLSCLQLDATSAHVAGGEAP